MRTLFQSRERAPVTEYLGEIGGHPVGGDTGGSNVATEYH